ncbi:MULTISPECIES: PRTRC system protein B [unclassified Arcicella]|jgi:PRTRC genetic system protein B|uniref:PRTRC system protein B n=1 Tax=unclassified Arcicella TaxID=2644986 RepID=UPI002858017B|nr:MULTISPECIES: PRTRC system protein B [unclassified Arcicella]MCA6441089.1 PRTRC system protein B [Chitinophagaceae bacterium]MCA6447821.1 PRTRC system protein B [Chitinophagaceae bacterium]MDR6561451.1 PRTRC genetic system protein B [Arcicella sp. BE51]MDR6811335.1 PRTRC genetic system protein B [Arcicella sp. BE140]MDR6822685.1 PRTRC genetic system protein B [Arcicella sp. BE139]
MNNENNIAETFGTLYHPKSALVFYEATGTETAMYVEHFDMDRNGTPINAHPLTVKEANVLAKSLQTDKEKSKAFLKPMGILPTNILHINPSEKGTVLWYTKAQQRKLYFVNGLDIPNGTAQVPPMLWFANKNNLAVFALATDRRPTEKTPLHYAPFFNIYEDGKVCMGTVTIDIKKSASVEEFVQAWESYFFNSYFSHLLGSHSPIKGNCVNVWKDLIGTDKPFPKEVLKGNNKTLKNLL